MRIPRILKLLALLLLLLWLLIGGHQERGEPKPVILKIWREGNTVFLLVANEGNAPLDSSLFHVSTEGPCTTLGGRVGPGERGVLTYSCPPGDVVTVEQGRKVLKRRLP